MNSVSFFVSIKHWQHDTVIKHKPENHLPVVTWYSGYFKKRNKTKYERYSNIQRSNYLMAASAATGRRCPACWPQCLQTAISSLPSIRGIWRYLKCLNSLNSSVLFVKFWFGGDQLRLSMIKLTIFAHLVISWSSGYPTKVCFQGRCIPVNCI